MKRFLLIFCVLLNMGIAYSQKDSVAKPLSAGAKKDSTVQSPSKLLADSETDSMRTALIADSLRSDSLKKATIMAPVMVPDTVTYEKYNTIPYLPLNKRAIYQIIPERKPVDKDLLFYILTGLVALLATIRLSFPKYFKNLFLLFMQTSIRQKQTREQLLQNNLASLLLNFLFIASGGIYISLLIQYKQWVVLPFYQLLIYCSSVLFIIYLGKNLFLMFSGWVFNVREATSAYTFIVLLVNKVLGIVLVPFVLILTFSPLPIMRVALTISIGITAMLFLYRYLVSFGTIRSNLKVSALHFFLYLCAVELLPLVLIYKLLLNYIAGSI